ncbi:inositol monophosphatase family protein [Actinomadura rupiterrae]|uniref:inositol monophosphatase family protein n=1 Tax=Actinomadura rupiterrae TaxID=559627 RepID=UPI0020A2A6AC|nr:inositol monophosphatase family protein [Actinomadura rupiterrae]MCP2337088.1 histidinol-phosphatase [Actinomadura rupiterrae]
MDDLAVALALADVADAITLRHFRSAGLAIRTKADRSLVTEADTETETALRAYLAEHRPHDTVLGEEEGGVLGDRCWLLDPVDHTANFARGMPVFATLIALAEDGRPTVGVVSAPAMGRRWWASRGGGAFGDGERLRVSTVDDLSDATLSIAALHRWDDRNLLPEIAALARRARNTWGSGGFWSQMLVAEGRIDACLDPWGKPWDLAASKIIIEEAGGRLTDLTGAPRIDQDCALATNTLLHPTLIRALDR